MPFYLILKAERRPWQNTPEYVRSHPGSEEMEWVIDWVPVPDDRGECAAIEAPDAQAALNTALMDFPSHSLAVQEATEYARTHAAPNPLHGFSSSQGRRISSPNRGRRGYSQG